MGASWILLTVNNLDKLDGIYSLCNFVNLFTMKESDAWEILSVYVAIFIFIKGRGELRNYNSVKRKAIDCFISLNFNVTNI